MERLDVLDAISDLLDGKCRQCKERAALYRQYGASSFARIDGHCNRNCPVGQQLQSLGRQLKLGERKIIEEDGAHDHSD
ncbi:zinc-finger domain-containing protein [Paenibacillus aurantiacus]|uniref:Zinc-finger domain-containing protein n=1 Tax=Paenibacillus aurantiacus TaxID=1936118 RepID=A0ABV5L0P1_9BACL